MYERFADRDFGALPETSLARIMDINAHLSRTLWSAWVSRKYPHLCTIPAVERPAPLARAHSDWEQVSEGRALIQRLLGCSISPAAVIVHFWSPMYAVHTQASLFLQHWDDFWYPSDDNDVLVFPHLALRIEFVEERLCVYRIEQSSTS